MTLKVQIKIFAFCCLMLQFCCQGAMARTLAFFPLLDLSLGPNGVNYVLSDHVHREVETLGFEMVSEEEIMQFMIRHRIRQLGQLSSYEVSLVGEELGADLVLQGTVCQLEEGAAATVSLSMQLFRTKDEKMIWAHTEGLYYADLLSLLGISDPQNLGDLYEVFFSKLLADMPYEVDVALEERKLLDIDSIVLHPDYARPADTITCKVTLHRSVKDAEEQPNIVARIGTREYPLILDEEGYYFETTWLAADTAGDYTVTLTGTWPSGMTRSGVVGTYYVDDSESGVRLIINGKELEGRPAFNNKLIIIPKLINPEPVTRWQISVIDEEDAVIVKQGASEHIPKRLTWSGKTNLGTVAPDGEYTIRFESWDRAGNISSYESTVSFRRRPPDIDILVSEEDGNILVELDNLENTPLSFWWLKVFQENGKLLKLAEGEEMPVLIDVAIQDRTEGDPVRLEGLLMVRDIMGNQTTRKINNLLQMAEVEEIEEINLESEWVEEF
jgi:hypothetical protein